MNVSNYYHHYIHHHHYHWVKRGQVLLELLQSQALCQTMDLSEQEVDI